MRTKGAKNRNHGDRREEILRAACGLFSRDGFHAASMKDLCAAAGMSPGSLYRYFPSKERLFATALIRWAQTFQQSYERTIRSAETDPSVRVRRTMHVALKAFERNPRFFGLLMALQGSDDPEVAALYERYTGTTSNVVRDALDGIDERWIEPIETLVWAAVFNLLRRWSLGRMPMSEVRNQLDDCIDVIFSSPTGARLAG